MLLQLMIVSNMKKARKQDKNLEISEHAAVVIAKTCVSCIQTRTQLNWLDWDLFITWSSQYM